MEKIKSHMEQSEFDPRFIKHIEGALAGMIKDGVPPYRIALSLMDLSSVVIQVGLPNEELGGFARYMQRVGKIVEQHSEYCEDLIRMSGLVPPPDDEDLRDFDAPPYR